MSFLTPLYEKPNHVLDKQRYYQAFSSPVHLRGPRQRLYLGAYAVLFASGMLTTVFATASLIRGKSSK